MTSAAPQLTLGPVLYNWPAEKRRDFYFRIADEAPIDVVYIGEITCSKRAPFFSPYIPEVCERLEAAGKEVVLSTLALVMSRRERKELNELASESPRPIEANDLSAINLLRHKKHVIGPFVNVYNEGTLEHFYESGASRVVLSCELPSTSVAQLGKAANGRELEVQTFGRLPLALSARCYHARSHNLTKDGCQYVCELNPDGMDVRTLDGTPFLAVNGTQTMSYTMNSLLGELDHLKEVGITHFRLWPHDMDMVEVAHLFRNVLDNPEDSKKSLGLLQEIVTIAPLSNGFFHSTEGFRMVE
ncbi:ubiquinone anaerobic biosynthesis protein UbiV [Sneathiella sp. HT1-7]|uniref:ubiquinone anaerobic biosynthesis protein UbiV n=1 Tax=Sneathiella sp. HT1-7 TaxID=2887192 RepID=UPI001D1523E7|nr:U32 family peptidase [Sneathiella sp. HT1-7]MCC3306754.1 U32 family peptidase [Sneathiella sp. HT1-7]